MLNGRPIHRMPHPCPCKRRPSHLQCAGIGALLSGRLRPHRLLPPRLREAAPPREERRVRPGRGYCMGAVSHNRPGKQPCPRKRQFPARGRRPGCRSVRSYFSAELYAPQRCQAVDRPAHVHGTPRQCRNAVRGWNPAWLIAFTGAVNILISVFDGNSASAPCARITMRPEGGSGQCRSNR